MAWNSRGQGVRPVRSMIRLNYVRRLQFRQPSGVDDDARASAGVRERAATAGGRIVHVAKLE